MLGYDLPRLHAVLNDLPAALLVAAVFFELVSLVGKREGFRQAGFWTLILGAVGAAAATLSGLQAEEEIAHGDAVHRVMETHELYAFITMGVFGAVALWRAVRERRMEWRERMLALFVSLVGTYFLLLTGMYGGRLVFEHAAGIPTQVILDEVRNREAGHSHEGGGDHSHGEAEAHSHGEAAPEAPGAGAPAADTGHTHAPGTPAHDHGPSAGGSATDGSSEGGHTHPPGTPPHRD